MQYFRRFEFKYLLRENDAEILKHKLLSSGMVPDPESLRFRNHTYPVTSLYFDTPRMEDYADKAGGFLNRKKIRIRIYTPVLTEATPQIWLEKKEKVEMLMWKSRVSLSYADYTTILHGSRIELLKTLNKRGEQNAHKIFFSLFAEKMNPVIIVRYLRTPLILKNYSDIRVTLDRDLETCQSRDLRYTPFMEKVRPGQTILEVKFSKFMPHWFKSLVQRFELIRTTNSKYGESLEKVYRFHPIPR